VKADLIKATVRWGGLETPPKEEGGSGAGGVTISINLGGQTLDVTAKAKLPPVEDADVLDDD
jgi:hypothetical protein